MRKIFKKINTFPCLLLFLSFLVYGLFIPFLGLFWDDFPYLWFKHTTGISGVMQAIALDRPLLAIFYTVPMAILGENPLVWQIAAILTRWLLTLSIYELLKSLWSNKKREIQLITLLILVFPGFKQQWVSVIYTHVFIVMALYFYSLILFVKSIKHGNEFSPMMLFSIVLSFVCITAVEYTAGLELLRPFIILMLVSHQKKNIPFKKKLGETIRLWLPYLLPFVVFLIYRVFIASSVLYKVQQMDNLTSNPFTTIVSMIGQQFKNVYISTVAVWQQIVEPLTSFNFATLFSKLYLAMFLFFFVGIYLFLKHLSANQTRSLSYVEMNKSATLRQAQGSLDRKWLLEAAIGAFLSLLASGLPYWAANLSPGVDFPSDRVLLPFMIGSSILVFGLIYLLNNSQTAFRVLFSLVFSLSAVFQLYQANQFRNDWESFEQFMQQLNWRIPSLDEDTLLVTDELPLKFYSDNSLTAAFNWIYGEQTHLEQEDGFYPLHYLINYTESRLGASLSSLEPGTAVNHHYRTYAFSGSTDQMILFYHEPPGCVHLVDPDLDATNPLLPAFLREYAQNSRDDLISDVVLQTDVNFISGGSQNSWCYYYEKAALAADLGQWEQIVELGNTAFNLDDHPNDAAERFPFIEGYARTGDWENALQLSRDTAQISKLYHPMLCQLWQILDAETKASQEKSAAMEQLANEITCELDESN